MKSADSLSFTLVVVPIMIKKRFRGLDSNFVQTFRGMTCKEVSSGMIGFGAVRTAIV